MNPRRGNMKAVALLALSVLQLTVDAFTPQSTPLSQELSRAALVRRWATTMEGQEVAPSTSIIIDEEKMIADAW